MLVYNVINHKSNGKYQNAKNFDNAKSITNFIIKSL